MDEASGENTTTPASVETAELVDLVYLWVDGADPLWQCRRAHDFDRWIALNPDQLALHGNSSGRYRDNGELLFNLRAVERFLTNVGHIYVVTDNQRPSWLQTSAPLTIIDHRDLVGDRGEAIYDSGNVESYLHRIPGLSERFVYLNDDVFFGSPLDLSSWFSPTMKVYLETGTIAHPDTPQRWEPAPVNAAARSKELLLRLDPAYVHRPATFSHAPRPMRKSVMVELEHLLPQVFAESRSTTFREWRLPSLLPDFVPRWMTHTGLATAEIFDSLYISTCSPEADEQFAVLEADFGTIPFFCINDTCDEADVADPRLTRIAETLQRLLPQPSTFERISAGTSQLSR